jgi:hypothetical protein
MSRLGILDLGMRIENMELSFFMEEDGSKGLFNLKTGR